MDHLTINLELQFRDKLAERLVRLAAERGKQPVEWLAEQIEELIERQRPALLEIENFQLAAAISRHR